MFLFSKLKKSKTKKPQATPLSPEDLNIYRFRKFYREFVEETNRRLTLADKQQKTRCSSCCWGQ